MNFGVTRITIVAFRFEVGHDNANIAALTYDDSAFSFTVDTAQRTSIVEQHPRATQLRRENKRMHVGPY